MKEIKVFADDAIYINFKGEKYFLSWRVDHNGNYVAYCQGYNWLEACFTEEGDDWREEAFCCLPVNVQRAFDFVKFV